MTPSLSDQVYQEVFQRIVDRRLLPGDIVDRRGLAEQLGLSLSPVSQAVARLEMEGFLEVLSRRVTRVRMLREEDFRALTITRNALECQAARLVCGGPVKTNEERLLNLAREVDATREGARINWPAEIALHRALVELIDSPGFLREYDRVMRLGHFVLVGAMGLDGVFAPDPTGVWHVDLVKSLRTRKPDKAERAMREHVEAGRESLLRPQNKGKG